jgi:hypothetical protein
MELSGRRTTTAYELGDRIITPSMTACPPTFCLNPSSPFEKAIGFT